jgi:hypothetical protein
MNRVVAARMEEIFTRRGIPVVPNLGNCCLPALEAVVLNIDLQVIMMFGVSVRVLFVWATY